MRRLCLAAIAMMGAASAACAGAEETGGEEPTVDPLEFPEGTGQEPSAHLLPYAPGPYGMTERDTLPNLAFYGFHDSTEQGDELEIVQLAELYNPNGDGVWPEGTRRAGDPLPIFLVLTGTTGW